jgi:hypothetical protein
MMVLLIPPTTNQLHDEKKRLITEVESVQEKNEEKINKERHDICQLTSILKDNKQELEFIKENIMLTTEITNLDVCVYFTVYFRR